MSRAESATTRTPQVVVYAAAISLLLVLTFFEAWRWRVSSPAAPESGTAAGAYLQLQPDAFYRVAWEGVAVPDASPSGGTVRMLLTVRNVSGLTWPDAQMADPVNRGGGGAVRIGYRWWRANEDLLISDYDKRTSLPWPMRSMEAVTLPVEIQLPAAAGRYRLQIDLIHELVTWFEKRGAMPLLIPVLVQPRG